MFLLDRVGLGIYEGSLKRLEEKVAVLDRRLGIAGFQPEDSIGSR